MSINDLVVMGGDPEFRDPLPVGQLFFPTWHEYETAMKGIFDRQYYTNHGPLVSDFESALADFLGVREVISVTNNTIGLIMVADALKLRGKVIIPSFTFAATALSLKRCGLTPVFCDISSESFFPSVKELEDTYEDDVSAVIGVHLWGSCAPISSFSEWASKKRIKIYWDSAQAFGCHVDNQPVGGNGVAEIFSFHATKVLSCAEGGCITTNNSGLADHLRNIRSSYGVKTRVDVNRTTNGRMSEFQAALGLLALGAYENNVKHNLLIRTAYQNFLKGIDGIEIVPVLGNSISNYQSLVILVDKTVFGIDRDSLLNALRAEGILARRYFLPSLHTLPQFTFGRRYHLPNTEAFQAKNIVMPIGGLISVDIVERICRLIRMIKNQGANLSA